MGTGRDTRLFTPSAIRSITARDRCCQMPACTRTRWLQAHHVTPWSEGGETTIANGCLVCASCHLQLHEGNLRLERVTRESVALPEHKHLTMTADEQSRARAAIAGGQRFRLVRRDGRYVAGPRRREDSCVRSSANLRGNLCGNENGADCHDCGMNGDVNGSTSSCISSSKSGGRGSGVGNANAEASGRNRHNEIDTLSRAFSGDQLEQYRVA